MVAFSPEGKKIWKSWRKSVKLLLNYPGLKIAVFYALRLWEKWSGERRRLVCSSSVWELNPLFALSYSDSSTSFKYIRVSFLLDFRTRSDLSQLRMFCFAFALVLFKGNFDSPEFRVLALPFISANAIRSPVF